MVATLPITTIAQPNLSVGSSEAFPGRPEWSTGITFVDDHGAKFFDFLTWARWASLPFSLLGVFVCFRWARELAGETARLVACACWCLGPTMLANAQLITPDMAATSVGLLAAYTFRGWLKLPTWKTTVIAGVCFGLALLCKMTWIILFGLWPVLWVALRRFVRRRERAGCSPYDGPPKTSSWKESNIATGSEARRTTAGDLDGFGKPSYDRTANTEFGQLCAMLMIGVWVLNLGYEFDGSFRELGEFDFVSKTLRGTPDGEWEGFLTGNKFRGTMLENVPVPLPSPFVEGIDFQKNEFDAGYWSYLLGVHRQEGWWYYYLLSLLWKVPVGFWIVGVVGTIEWLRVLKSSWSREVSKDDQEGGEPSAAAGKETDGQRPWLGRETGHSKDGLGGPSYRFSEHVAEAVLLLAPALTVLVLVSSHTGFTHHLRYVLPVVPFGFIWASRAAVTFARGYNWRSALTACGLAWGISSSLCATPNHLAYFNELVGGPTNAHHYMGLGPMDSNLVWGQDLLRLAEWTRNNPYARLDGVAYGGLGQVRKAAGITGAWPPSGEIPPGEIDVCARGPRPGWYALSVSRVFSEKSEQNYFQYLNPFTTIGHTVYVYHVTQHDADQLWYKLHGDRYDRSDCAWRRSPQPEEVTE